MYCLTVNSKGPMEHFEGPAMILAGPGSGKTTVVTNRILNMIDNCKVNPEKYPCNNIYKDGSTPDERAFFKTGIRIRCA